MKETIDVAVRMVGHLLERHGITGPFFADKDGNHYGQSMVDHPQINQYCMWGATLATARKLQLNEEVLGRAILGVLAGSNFSTDSTLIITFWERTKMEHPLWDPSSRIPYGGGYRARLNMARKLQMYGNDPRLNTATG